jgi:hypothetical protein
MPDSNCSLTYYASVVYLPPELMGMKTVSPGLIGMQTARPELMRMKTVSPGLIGMQTAWPELMGITTVLLELILEIPAALILGLPSRT